MEFLSLKDHVYNYIAEQIRLGKLDSNQKVNEQSICDQLNISRTPVREALIQLAADGFLESAPRRGFRVKPLTLEESQDIYLVLSHLDTLAVELAMDQLNQDDFKKMSDLVDLMDFHIDRFDFIHYFPLQEDFHNIYIHKTKNQTLIDTMSRLQRRFIRQLHIYGEDEKLQDLVRETNQQHKKIIALLKDKRLKDLQDFLVHTHWNCHFTEADHMSRD